MTFRIDEDRVEVCSKCRSSRCRVDRLVAMSWAIDADPTMMKRGRRRRTVTKQLDGALRECDREARSLLHDFVKGDHLVWTRPNEPGVHVVFDRFTSTGTSPPRAFVVVANDGDFMAGEVINVNVFCLAPL